MRLPLFRKTEAAGPSAAELLRRARTLQSEGKLAEAETLADQALDLQERAVGPKHASLVPYLLVEAGILFQRYGWGAGRPLYERAQALRGPLPPRRLSPPAPRLAALREGPI
jgi:hypothetical protein